MPALFSGTRWYDYKERRLAAAREVVDEVPAGAIASSTDDELTDELMERLGIEPIELNFEARTRDDAAEIVMPWPGFDGQIVKVRGTRVVVHIPFTGEPELFRVTPTNFGSTAEGEVRDNEVLITWEGRAEYAVVQAPAHIDRNIEALKKCAAWSLQDCERFNTELRTHVRTWLGERRGHLDVNRQLGNVLGIPRRSDASALLIPVPQRRRVAVAPPSWSAGLDPKIADADYAAIMQQLSSARYLIERLPDTFAPMREEALRDILLVILNNNFGPAGGEMFSRRGKTDILIQHQEGAVFIAECKKWKGSAAAIEAAITQLLDYLAWRDTKAALILFVGDKDVTGLTDKASAALAGHVQHVRRGAPIGDVPTFILHHEGDELRHIRIALLVIPIPKVRPDQAQPAAAS